MSDPAYIAQALLWSVCCAVSFAFGRGWARASAMLLFLQMLAELLAYKLVPGSNTKITTALTDAIIFATLCLALFSERRLWAAAAAGGQLMSIAILIVRALTPHVGKWASVTALNLFGYWVLAAVMVGALTSRRLKSA